MHKSVLILNNSLLGDFIMFSPIIKILFKLNLKMFVISNNHLTHKFVKIYEDDGIVCKADLLRFTKPLDFTKLLIFSYKEIKPEYIFITFSFDSIKSQVAFKLLQANNKLIRSSKKTLILDYLYKNYLILDLMKKHLVDQNVEYLEKYLGTKIDRDDIKLFLPPTLSRFGNMRPIKNSIVIHPGSSAEGVIRRYPVDKYIKIAKHLIKMKYNVHFLLGPSEEEYSELLKHHNLNYIFSNDFIQTAKIIGSFEVFLGSDSFVSHLAAALERTTFTIFGPSNPIFSRPYSDKSIIIQRKDKLDCMPCYLPENKTGCQSRKCLDIEEEYIIETMLKYI